MALKYLYSGAGGSADGSSWANAYTTMSVALAAMAAGDDLAVAHDHSESTASAVTLTSPGTGPSPCRIYCVNRAGSVPPVSADLRTTAQVATTGASNILTVGKAYCEGVIFSAGSAANSASINTGSTTNPSWFFKNCTLKLNNTNSASRITFGNGSQNSQNRNTCNNVIFSFGATGQFVSFLSTYLEVIGGSVDGAATIPTNLFNFASGSTLHVHGMDISALGSGKNIFSAANVSARALFEKCKLGASVTPAATPTVNGTVIDFVNCDSGATQYRNERYTYMGVLTTETTIICTAPSSGPGPTDGTTAFSHKIVTTANDNVQFPFESFPMGDFYADTLNTSVSQTYELLTDNVVLTNADAWIELEYLGSSATPIGSIVSSAPADILAAAANLTTSGATWAGTGGFTLAKPQKITVSFTPQLVGTYRAVLKVAKASTTVYLSPPAPKAA